MLDAIESPLAALLGRRQAGHSLEAAFYTSDAVFRADMDIIFGRHWIQVGVSPDVPEPGDAMTVDIGAQTVLIVRDDDMQIRAFHNVCRHRGARLLPPGKSAVGNLVCRYHTWTYGLDGALLHANHMGAAFDTACHGLKPIHLRNVAGLLFICLGANPPDDIDEMARIMTPYLAPHAIEECKVAAEIDLIENGNWKLTMENNRECYHCSGNHPELTVPLFAYGFGFAPDSVDEAERQQIARYEGMVQNLRAGWESCGMPSALVERLDDAITGFRTERLPIDQAGESQTADTRRASQRLLGRLTDARLGGLTFWTQPNSWHHVMADHVVTFCAIPLDAEHTLVRTKWLVHKDAIEGRDYDLGNLTNVWTATNAQDAALVEMAQAGVRSPAYEPGPYSPHTEMLVEKFCRWYLGRMAAHLS